MPAAFSKLSLIKFLACIISSSCETAELKSLKSSSKGISSERSRISFNFSSDKFAISLDNLDPRPDLNARSASRRGGK